jgi:glycosyltransferase involved in cell wall biosynthesis
MKDALELISVVMPVHNARGHLVHTLPAIKNSDYPNYELIVVDCSTDGSLELAREFADTVIELKEKTPPAKARNKGAEISKGPIVLFVDADVKIAKDTLSKVASAMQSDSQTAALFGSYDADPLHRGFFSQYKNLFHHYVHQNANPDSASFWAGCGAVRRQAFLKTRGFPEEYPCPSIEDVDFGSRLIEAGEKIILLKDIQVTHLKKWSFWNLLRTDIFNRAIPWTRLACTRGLAKDLNFKTSDRISGILACVLALSLILMWEWRILIPVTLFSAGMLLYLNRKLYRFFLEKKGFLFSLGALAMHWFYLFYSSVVFGIFIIYYKVFSKAIPAQKESSQFGKKYWDNIGQTSKDCSKQDLWRRYSQEAHLDLISRWDDGKAGALLLKTDLYDEAVSDHGFRQFFSQQGKRVIGMDISFEVAQEAEALTLKKKEPQNETVVTDVRNLPFDDATFDEIISNSTLDHFSCKQDILTSARELYRVLKPGGSLIITLDNPINPAVFLRNILPYKMLKSTNIISYYMGATLSRSGLVRMLESSGFRVTDSAFLLHAPRLAAVAIARLLSNRKNASAIFCKFLKAFEILARSPLRTFTANFVAVRAVKEK